MTLSEIADKLHRLPGLASSFVMQIERSEERQGRKTDGGGYHTTINRNSTFRVCLVNSKGKCADCERPALWQALEDAFGIVGLPMPDEFAFIEI